MMKKNSRYDSYGNAIICFRNGNFIDVYLKLAHSHRREVGTIYVQERVLEVKRNRRKHLMRKANAYGFNHFLIEKAERFDTIRLLEDGNTEYLIPRQLILDKGTFLHFLKVGFEKQIFLSLDIIKNLQHATTDSRSQGIF